MAELKVGYQAVFYSGEKVISRSGTKEKYEEAVSEIERENDLWKNHKYNPWTHAQVEKVYYRH